MRLVLFPLLALLALPVARADGDDPEPASKVPTAPKTTPRLVTIAQILVSYKGAASPVGPVTRTKDEARARAAEALAYARRPDVSWRDAVSRYTDDARGAMLGGLIGTMPRGRMTAAYKAIEDIAFGMEVGQVADVLETPVGFHILSRRSVDPIAISHVLVMHASARKAAEVGVTRSSTEALKLATDVLEQLRKGAKFAHVAARHSDGPSAKLGGYFGVYDRGSCPIAELEAAARKLKPGELGGPVKSPFGYHVILRREYLRASHILIQYVGALNAGKARPVTRLKAEAKALAEKVLAEARAGKPFAALATTHSDGPSAKQAGDLGPLVKGEMLPPFDKVAFALKPGDFGLAETRYGFHVIWRTD